MRTSCKVALAVGALSVPPRGGVRYLDLFSAYGPFNSTWRDQYAIAATGCLLIQRKGVHVLYMHAHAAAVTVESSELYSNGTT